MADTETVAGSDNSSTEGTGNQPSTTTWPKSDPKTSGILEARENIDAYEKHVHALKNGEEITSKGICEMLGLRFDPDNSEINEFLEQMLNEILMREQSYAESSSTSLKHQESFNESAEEIPTAEKVRENIYNQARDLTESGKIFKDRVKPAYFKAMRSELIDRGLIASPQSPHILGAVFPKTEWKTSWSDPKVFLKEVKAASDQLMKKYKLVGDDSDSINRLLKVFNKKDKNAPPKKKSERLDSGAGCLCISWTRHQPSNGSEPVYIPVLGISGIFTEDLSVQEVDFDSYCNHLALPKWEGDPKLEEYPREEELNTKKNKIAEQLNGLSKKRIEAWKKAEGKELVEEVERLEKERFGFIRNQLLEKNYDTMLTRTNRVLLEYKIREALGLRRPSRQAILSYVSFQHQSPANLDRSFDEKQQGIDLYLCGWHSLNCAEPAALMTASSVLGEGTDVVMCLPYEGNFEAGESRNRPKDTCPWCATVEPAFRSLSQDDRKPDAIVADGSWKTQFTHMVNELPPLKASQEFDAFGKEGLLTPTTELLSKSVGEKLDEEIVKTGDPMKAAYNENLAKKIGRLRNMYHMLGLLDQEMIAFDRDLFKSLNDQPDSQWTLI